MAIVDETPDTATVEECWKVGCHERLLIWEDDCGYVDIQHGENREHRRTFVQTTRSKYTGYLVDVYGESFAAWVAALHEQP